jgi:uncharacterized protein involved in outer membrane biogenesis
MSQPTVCRRRRWLIRIAIGVLALAVLAVLAVTLAVHTSPGREMLRAQVEQRLASTFVGGATLGGVEGNPFGEMTLHDLVINGADHRPAFSIKTLVVSVGILPLMSHQARVLALRADGVDVDLRRNAQGELVTQGLTHPGPPSAWSVSLPEVRVRNAHVRFDTGREVMNFDGVAFDGWAKLPHGGPIDTGVDLRGTWRERRAPLVLKTALRSDPEGLAAPYLIAHAGDVAVIGNQLKIRTAPPPGEPTGAIAPAHARMPAIGGVVFVNASAAAVQRLMPDVRLPADFVIQISAAPVPGSRWTTLGITGKVDQTPVAFTGTADLDARQLKGKLDAGALDITRLSGGKLAGRAAGIVEFDVRPGGPRALPIASATIRGWGELAGVPRTDLDIAVSSAGERAHAVVHAAGQGVRADLVASVRSVGDALAIEGATLRATSSDPARASGGKAPVHGALQIDLQASGALRPAPNLAIAGTVEGRRLHMQGLSVSALHVAVDARQVPTRPLGKAHVQLVDLVRNNAQLGELTVDATDRPDGKIAVAMRSQPKQNPWLIDANAVITPPGDLGPGRFAIDLVGHHVRAGSGSDWYGKTGHIDITPERIALRDLASKSNVGSIAVTGNFQRAGRHRGDLAANLDVTSLTLDNLTGALAGSYRGKIDAHAVVTRTDGAWQGNVDLDGRGLSFTAASPVVASAGTSTAAAARTRLSFDTQVHAGLHGRRLTVAANVASGEVGSARIAIDADAPTTAAAPAAWQRLGRNAIRTAELTLRGVDVRRAVELAGLPASADYAGKIDGGIQLTGDTTGGRIEVRNLAAPALRGVTVTAALELSQRSPREITPRLTVTGSGVGNATAQAELEMPEKPFDPAAWRRLGRGALHGASLRSEGITIDPGLLDRLGITSELRGRAGFSIDVGDAARTAQAVIDVGELRGGPIAQPVDIHLTAGLDERTTTTALTVASKGAPLIQVTGRLPASLAELLDRRGDPAALKATPLSATAKLAQTDAARLLAVVGRSEITGGRIDGGIELSGTLGKPRVAARLVASKLTIPPGPHGKPVRTVEQMTIVAGWDGTTAKLDIDGAESAGGKLKLTGQARPDRLREGTLSIVAEKFDMVPILAFAPGPAGGSSGELDANLRLIGLDLRTAQIAGELHLRNARIPTAPTVGTLRQAKIDAIVAEHEIRIAVDGKLGGGSATMTGSIALDGAAPNGGQAKIKLNKISPIGTIEPQITADVTARLSRDRDQWRAELVVDNGQVNVPKERGEKLKPVGAPPDMLFANGQRITQRPIDQAEPSNPIFIVVINIRSTHVESEEFRGLIKGRLELRADGSALAIYGSIDADRGDLDLFSRRYYVDRASVHFDGSLDPLLDIRITHDFPDVTTVTEVRGRASKPELVMTSDPGNYTQGQLLGFLLGGEPGGDPQAGPLQSQVAGAGESYVANQIGGYVRKALPIDIDVLRYEAATATTSAAITVGTWLNSSLFLAYRQHLDTSRSDENTGEGQIEYWLTRRLMVQGTVGDRADGLDLLWRKRY